MLIMSFLLAIPSIGAMLISPVKLSEKILLSGECTWKLVVLFRQFSVVNCYSNSGTGAKVPVMAPSASNSSQLVEPGISSQMQFGSPSIDNHGYAAKLHKGGSTEPLSGSTSVDLVAGRSAAGRAVEQEGGSQVLIFLYSTISF